MAGSFDREGSQMTLELSLARFSSRCGLMPENQPRGITDWLDVLDTEKCLLAVGRLSREYLEFFPTARVNPRETLLSILTAMRGELRRFDGAFTQLVDVYLGLKCHGYTGEFWCWTNGHQLIMRKYMESDEISRLQKILRLVDEGFRDDIRKHLEFRLEVLVSSVLGDADVEISRTYLNALRSRRAYVENNSFLMSLLQGLEVGTRYQDKLDSNLERADQAVISAMCELSSAVFAKDLQLANEITERLAAILKNRGLDSEHDANVHLHRQQWWDRVDPNWWREQE